jgi:hypothetical protein
MMMMRQPDLSRCATSRAATAFMTGCPKRVIKIADEIRTWRFGRAGITANTADATGSNGIVWKQCYIPHRNFVKLPREFDSDHLLERKPGGHQQGSAFSRSEINEGELCIFYLKLGEHRFRAAGIIAHRIACRWRVHDIEGADLPGSGSISTVFFVERIFMRRPVRAAVALQQIIHDIVAGQPEEASGTMPAQCISQTCEPSVHKDTGIAVRVN